MTLKINLNDILKQKENKKAVTLYLDYDVLEEVRDIYKVSVSKMVNEFLKELIKKKDEVNFQKRK